MPKTQSLIDSWKQDELARFTGWDFSYIENRMNEDLPPWSYMDRARQLIQPATSCLDMGTGGGERLLELQQDWPAKVVATEAYPPNKQLILERLAPLGVAVFDVNLTLTDPMPFADNEFDVVLNRHAAFNPGEVTRILSTNGIFLTQQVHGRSTEDLMAVFECKPQWSSVTAKYYIPRLKAAGLVVTDIQEWSGFLRFHDVGAIVYYLRANPWLVPDFSVDSQLDGLMALQSRLDNTGSLKFQTGSFLIEAAKNK